jgi:hypothetical protein
LNGALKLTHERFVLWLDASRFLILFELTPLRLCPNTSNSMLST